MKYELCFMKPFYIGAWEYGFNGRYHFKDLSKSVNWMIKGRLSFHIYVSSPLCMALHQLGLLEKI